MDGWMVWVGGWVGGCEGLFVFGASVCCVIVVVADATCGHCKAWEVGVIMRFLQQIDFTVETPRWIFRRQRSGSALYDALQP